MVATLESEDRVLYQDEIEHRTDIPKRLAERKAHRRRRRSEKGYRAPRFDNRGRSDGSTDSELCVNTITKWAPAWHHAGWRRKKGAIANLDLVKKLLALYEARPECTLR